MTSKIIKNISKTILVLLTILWMIVWITLGLGGFINAPTLKSDKYFIDKEIKPSVDFVKKYKKENNRLPSNSEFYKWERDYFKNDSSFPYKEIHQYIRNDSIIIDKDDLNKFKKADWNKDFAICVWHGDWPIYYFSWTDNYDSERYYWRKDFIGLIVILCITIFPLLFWFIYYKRKKRTSKEEVSMNNFI